jgi:UDP-N-acetylmuramoyl-L-alanyl-D-glutamate--2,6-diaminopimelate ligase
MNEIKNNSFPQPFTKFKTVREFVADLQNSFLAKAGGPTDSLSPEILSLRVARITADSREVEPGAIFVAIRGGAQNGNQFAEAAKKNGACLIVGEEKPQGAFAIPYLEVSDARMALARLAATFYHDPSQSLVMIGVTGTSGKTTTTYMIESILKAAGHEVGLIGTVNFRYGTKIFPSTHTTPGAVELQGLLAQMKQAGCTAVVMEVSSHALKQRRAAFISFDGMVFTNLSMEHLDFHPDMEDYFLSKKILFTDAVDFSTSVGKSPVAVVNQKDEYGKRLFQDLQVRVRAASQSSATNSFGIMGFQAGEGLQVTLQGIRGQVEGIPIESKMTGQFNCANIEGAVSLGKGLGLSSQVIAAGIKNLAGVPGRLERVENARGVHVWVDYAHKPDALEKVVKTLRDIRGSHRLITVFGCGGDRDRTKRSVMGRIAVEGSDQVFITSDNPRTEDPQTIIDEILQGTIGFSNFIVEADRKKAIFAAIQSARSGDLVLIAGKGHEDYQILGTKKVHFDDREVVTEAFSIN